MRSPSPGAAGLADDDTRVRHQMMIPRVTLGVTRVSLWRSARWLPEETRNLGSTEISLSSLQPDLQQIGTSPGPMGYQPTLCECVIIRPNKIHAWWVVLG